MVFSGCPSAVLCTSLPGGSECSIRSGCGHCAFSGCRSACRVCQLVGQNNRSFIFGGHFLDHFRPMDSVLILHPLLKGLEFVHLTSARRFEFPDCLTDETFHQCPWMFFPVAGKMTSDDVDILVHQRFHVFVEIAVRAVAHQHHHIESVCMAKQTQQLFKAMFLVDREWLWHGGAGQIVWKDEKRFCLETTINLWDVNLDFVTVPGLMRFQGFPGNRARERNER